MKLFKFLVLALFFAISINNAGAANNACYPVDVKPTKEETRLGEISVASDIVAVEQSMTIMVKSITEAHNLTINKPDGTDIIDYYPKTIEGVNITAGKWQKKDAMVPAGEYSLTVKPTKWTNGKWQPVYYSITNGQGTGSGHDYFYAYYDKVDFIISVDDRNQLSQTTKEVVRKVTVEAPAEINVNLSTSKGSVGTNISEKKGNQASQKVPGNGKAVFFLFTNESDKVKLTASSTDTCTDSTYSQDFKINKSEIGRTYKGGFIENYWWILLIIILLVVLVVFWIVKNKKEKSSTDEQNNTNISGTNL